MYHIQGNNRITKQKEIIRSGFETEEQALAHLKEFAKFYFKTHTYARVAKTNYANLHKTRNV